MMNEFNVIESARFDEQILDMTNGIVLPNVSAGGGAYPFTIIFTDITGRQIITQGTGGGVLFARGRVLQKSDTHKLQLLLNNVVMSETNFTVEAGKPYTIRIINNNEIEVNGVVDITVYDAATIGYGITTFGDPENEFPFKGYLTHIFHSSLSNNQIAKIRNEGRGCKLEKLKLYSNVYEYLITGDSCSTSYDSNNGLISRRKGTSITLRHQLASFGQLTGYVFDNVKYDDTDRLYFDGVNDSVILTNYYGVGNYSLYTEFTVTAYINCENVSGNKCLFASGGCCELYITNGKLWGAIYYSSGGAVQFGVGTIANNTDYFVSFRFKMNDTSKSKLQIDTTEWDGPAYIGRLYRYLNIGCIIGSRTGSTYMFPGYIKNVSLWNRSLSKAELDTLANNQGIVPAGTFGDYGTADFGYNNKQCLFYSTLARGSASDTQIYNLKDNSYLINYKRRIGSNII